MGAVAVIWGRLKRYLVAIGVGIAVAMQVVRSIRKSERGNIERERATSRLDGMKKAKRIQDDVESDPYLADRAREWVRRKD